MNAWLITLGAFGILAVIWSRNKPRWLWYVKPVLAVIGAGAFSATSWGATIGQWIAQGATLLTSFIGLGGAAVLGVVVVVLFLYLLLELGAEKRANSGVLIGLMILPILCGVAAGPVASSLGRFYNSSSTGGGSAITRLVGG